MSGYAPWNWQWIRAGCALVFIACFVATLLLPAVWGTPLLFGCASAVFLLLLADHKIESGG